MSKEEQLIAEFNALRAEIILLYSRRSTRLTVCWTGLSLVFAGAAAAKMPELTLLSIFIVSSAWIDDAYSFFLIQRIGAYIKVCLESELSGINWESSIDEASNITGYYKGYSNLLHCLSYKYSLSLLISIIGVVLFYFSFPMKLLGFGVTFLLILGFSIVLVILAIVKSYLAGKSKQIWENAFKSALNKSK
ncbi:hypothetical protein QUF75_14455 [Desulfococcaceae bacterium HSG7]|nr:hypothetical protein [Desulfococcaceae bacterium HSG7]